MHPMPFDRNMDVQWGPEDRGPWLKFMQTPFISLPGFLVLVEILNTCFRNRHGDPSRFLLNGGED